MPVHLSPELTDLRHKMKEFIDGEVIPAEPVLLGNDPLVAADKLEELKAEAKRRDLWALGHPAEIGGGGLPFMDFVYLNEIIGRSEYGQMAVGSVSMQDSIMLHLYASDEQRERFLKPLVAGEIYPSVGLTEPEVAGSDPTQMQTTAVLDGNEWVINGHKWFTSGAQRAAFTTVFAKTDPDADSRHAQFSAIIVPTDNPGYDIVRAVPAMGSTHGDHCEVYYRDVRVPHDNLLGERGKGFLIAQRRLGPGRIFHCMRWLGQAQRAFELMIQRANTRFAHGSLLREKGEIQRYIAESAAEIQAARLMTLDAAQAMDRGDEARVEISLIKFWGATMLHNVIDRAIQVHGALGVTGDTPLERMYREARYARLYDGPDEVHRMVVARCDPPGAPHAGAMALEASLLRAAEAAGVPVPQVVAAADDLIVVRRLSGETLARRILRDDGYGKARERLTEQCAAALARLHTLVSVDGIPGLPVDGDPLDDMRRTLDDLGEPHPALELGLLRLARTRPAATGRTLVHGDFRLGNLMVDGDGLAGVLDWELAHVGDPAEDLGWLCVPSWRFGGQHPVAGVGTRQELLSAYAAAGGPAVAEATLRWWEAFGTLRWGVICVRQAAAHLTGAVRSVELAAIGRRTCEVELDLLEELGEPVRTLPRGLVPEPLASVHDRPSAGELVEAVREWIERLQLTGHDAFLARVSSRALQIVERELASAPLMEQRHRERLDALGVADDAELAAQVRAGRDDPATVEAIRASVIDKLWIADPRLLQR